MISYCFCNYKKIQTSIMRGQKYGSCRPFILKLTKEFLDSNKLMNVNVNSKKKEKIGRLGNTSGGRVVIVLIWIKYCTV